MSASLDVIVPAYRGLDETRTCLESVLAATPRQRFHLVVIDDAGPDPALRAWLREQAAAGRFELLANAVNLGFVATVNRGMALHPDRDVLLLNSDTEVAGDWPDRIVAHARDDDSVGTITPLSTNATICSYPRTLQSNPLPPGETTASLDAACARANGGRAIEVPTAVGFCMFIRRRCLEAIGAFDVERYGAGYGEEVDFCMRATRAGFRHLLAADAFVRHVGEVSFGGTGSERRAQAQRTVDALYPEFQQQLATYIPADPSREARRRLDLDRLQRIRPPLRTQAGPAGNGTTGVLRLSPWSPTHAHLRWDREGEEFALWLPLDPGVLAPIARRLANGEPWGRFEGGWMWPAQPEGFATPAEQQVATVRLAACLDGRFAHRGLLGRLMGFFGPPSP